MFNRCVSDFMYFFYDKDLEHFSRAPLTITLMPVPINRTKNCDFIISIHFESINQKNRFVQGNLMDFFYGELNQVKVLFKIHV